MTTARQSLLQRFTERPPALAGGLRALVEPLDDKHVLLLIEDGERRFRARAAGLTVPYPSGLRRLVSADPSIEVVLVERVSDGLERAAEEQGIGVLDLDGRGRLRAPGFVYAVSQYGRGRTHRDERPRDSHYEARTTNAKVSAFAPKASRVVRALLSEPRAAWRVTDLAQRVDMNPGNAHRVLVALSEMVLVERDRDGYVVRDPGSLLEAWAENWRGPRKPEPITIRVPEGLHNTTQRVFASLNGAAAISGEFAAELYAPHLSASSAAVHCTDLDAWDPELLEGLAGVSPLHARYRINVMLSDPGVSDFGSVRDDLPLVSPQQLYVDLYRDRGRGREAGEHVRREVLGF